MQCCENRLAQQCYVSLDLSFFLDTSLFIFLVLSCFHSRIRPTPVSVSKYTLHTASLPKPQYPVPVSLSSTNVGANRFYNTNQRLGNMMDAKGAKHAANLNRKGGLMGR